MKKLTLLLALTMILFSCKPEAEKPTVTTKSVGEVTETTAKVVGQVTADGGAEVTERGVCWNTEGAPEVIDYRTVDGTGIGTFNSNISDLVPNTQYYVRAYATNEKGTAYGEEVSFTTEEVEEPEGPEDPENPEQPEEVAPAVTTAEVTEITVNSAVCGGEVISGGDAVIVARGVCWNTSGQPTVSDTYTYTMDGSNIGSYTSNMTNLEHNTTYYVRAYATNAKGVTGYGEEVTFKTLEKLLPTVTTTAEVTDITVNSAKCGGEVTFNGNVSVTARGICWSTRQNPTIEDSKTTNGSGVGNFTSQIPNLVPNTQYYVRAYATNEVGTAYGEEVSFTTLEKLLPTVTTATEVTDITVGSAKCGGEVTFDGNVSVTAGICWCTSPNPTIEDNKTTNGYGVGSFTSQIPNLVPNTQYYVRAYATNEVGTAYGEERTFKTLAAYSPATGTSNGYGYVDLGLSVKWATCNVGASSPEEYGDYFAWGETTTKDTYSTSNCPTYGLDYIDLHSQGYIDSEGNLTAQHDAATSNWGGTWRMPTYDELKELKDNCTWTWTTQNGVNGYNVKGPSGNSIFLPAAGSRDGSWLDDAGSVGYFWSSTSYDVKDYDDYAYDLGFDSSYRSMYGYCCFYGQSVRSVLE